MPAAGPRNRRLLAGLSSRSGRAADVAMAFGGTALVLVVLATMLIHTGAARSLPRRTDFGLIVMACAAAALVYAVLNRERGLALARDVRARLRPGERIVDTFGARLLRETEEGRSVVGPAVTLVITNMRVMLHRPQTGLDLRAERELDEVTAARNCGPAPSVWLQACVTVALEFADGSNLPMLMTLATAHELAPVRGWYLSRRPRRVRALVIETHGPLPNNPNQSLSALMDHGRPTLRVLAMEDNYLRVLADGPVSREELWWYFHWQHMAVGPLQPAALEGVPEDWLRLRLHFHKESSLVVCGRPGAIGRVRDKALAAGADELV